MRRLPIVCFTALASIYAYGVILRTPSAARADYPNPSIYPISWELNFDFEQPKRIVVQTADAAVPTAYWYVTYTITNKTDREQMFLPDFEMLTKDGRVIRSDNNTPTAVFDAIKKREGRKFLEPITKVAGTLLIGDDQAKESVAIWPEPDPDMGHFTLFVQGLSGETAQVPGPDNKSATLRKTLQLDYNLPGQSGRGEPNQVTLQNKSWVMR